MSGTALQKKTRERALAQTLARVAKEDLEIVRSARRAPKLFTTVDEGLAFLKANTDAELEAQGLTREQVRIAIHALLPKKDCPAYLHFAQERDMLRYRNGEGDKAPAAVTVLAAPGSTVQVATFTPEQLAAAPVYDMSKDE